MPESQKPRSPKPQASARGKNAAARLDAAHIIETAPEVVAPIEAVAVNPPVVEEAAPITSTPDTASGISVQQVRSQAAQLASHLQRQQAAVDHREAELNSRLAAMENQIRNARLWLNERQAELSQQKADMDRREAEISKREAEVGNDNGSKKSRAVEPLDRAAAHAERADELDRREAELNALAERWAQRVANAEQVQDVQQLLRGIETRAENLNRAEKLMAAEQAELERQRRQLDEERAAQAESAEANRQRRIEEHQRMLAEHDRMRQELKRQSDELGSRQNSLERMRAEIARSQQEALEIRLATEELWSRLCGTMAPAALTQSLAQIRLKLAEEQRLARADILQQRNEVQSLANCLTEQHAKLARERENIQVWATQRQKELEKQASQLVRQQQQMEERVATFGQQRQEWQSERFKLQQEIRRLMRQSDRIEIRAA